MQTLPQFEATKKEYRLAESEVCNLKRELVQLRAEFVQKTGVNIQEIDQYRLSEIEQKMCSIERTLAHTDIIPDEVRLQNDRMETLGEDIREVLNNFRIKVISAVMHTNKIQHHKHQNK
jgi:hypothetical protein